MKWPPTYDQLADLADVIIPCQGEPPFEIARVILKAGYEPPRKGELGVSPTFTDRDLYGMMQHYLPIIFWPTWEGAGQNTRASIAALANDIYDRLRGPEQPHEKPAGTESAGSGHDLGTAPPGPGVEDGTEWAVNAASPRTESVSRGWVNRGSTPGKPVEPCEDCGAPTDQGHHLPTGATAGRWGSIEVIDALPGPSPRSAEGQFREDELKRLHRDVGRALMDIIYGPCPQCEASNWYLRMPEREWQCGSCRFIVEMAQVIPPAQ